MNYELFLFGAGIILIMSTWKFMWLPTLLDSVRDRLFDLRDDKLTTYFIENGLGLDHPMYLALRTLINGHLRHTESVNLWEMMHLIHSLEKRPDINEHNLDIYNERFKTDDPNLKTFIEDIRLHSALYITEYMIHSSVFAFIFLIIYKIQTVIRSFSSTSSRLIKGILSPDANTSSRLAMEICALS